MKNLGKSLFHLNVSNVSNSSGLINITTATNHGFSTGNRVQIDGVVGTTEANGSWIITSVNATNFTLDGSAFANTYVSSSGKIYKPYRMLLKLSASPAGGAAYAFASVSFRPTTLQNVSDNDTRIFKLTNTDAALVFESSPTVAYRIDEIECVNRSTTNDITFSVQVTDHNSTMDPITIVLDAGERVSVSAGMSPVLYDASGRAIAGAMPPIGEP